MPSPWLIGALLLLGVCHQANAVKCIGSLLHEEECAKCYIQTADNDNSARRGCIRHDEILLQTWYSQTEDTCEAHFDIDNSRGDGRTHYSRVRRTKVCSSMDYCNARCGVVKPLKCLTNFELFWTPTNELGTTHVWMRKFVEPYVKHDCTSCVRFEGFFPEFTDGQRVKVAKDKVYYSCLTDEDAETGAVMSYFGKQLPLHQCNTMTLNGFPVSYYWCLNKDLCNAWCGAASIPMMHLVLGVVCALGFVVMRR
uniref:Conserved plasma membrane protein n=1 Tax=Panagrellus redivivus TaxID=6233 RepID=A0A7E4VF37_PANRE